MIESPLPDLLHERARATPDALAYASSSGRVTWREFETRAAALGVALHELGVGHGDSVGVLGQTTAEWAEADQGILVAGGVSVGIYPTLTGEQVRYLVDDAKTRVVIVGSKQDLALVRSADAKRIETIVAWGDAEGEPGTVAFSKLLSDGKAKLAADPDAAKRLESALSTDDVGLLVYTSGTTGPPKGAMLSHGNCTFMVRTLATLMANEPGHERTVSFLPMAHAAEHVIGFYGRIVMGVSTFFVGTMESDEVLAAIEREKPTIFGSVPRIFEKAYTKIQQTAARSSPVRRGIFRWAERVAREWSRKTMAGQPISRRLAAQHALADRIVYTRIRAAFGGEVRYFICGAAPIEPAVLELFHGAGLLVLEAYGLTECCGICTANRKNVFRFGTVGLPVPGVEVRIAGDGEILVRGPTVFKGYLNRPEATAEAIDAEGFLHTGDIGAFDPDGFLKITDRKKNLIVTSQGKNVAPAGIEARLAPEALLGPVLVVGDRRPYLTAIVTLDPEEAEDTAGRKAPLSELCTDPAIVERVVAAVRGANEVLARYERLRRIVIAPRELDAAGGEITPTMKVRRKQVAEHFAETIEALYAEPPGPDVIEIMGRPATGAA